MKGNKREACASLSLVLSLNLERYNLVQLKHADTITKLIRHRNQGF